MADGWGATWIAIGTWALVVIIVCAVLDRERALDRDWRAWIVPINVVLRGPIVVGEPVRMGIVYQKRGRQPALGLALETSIRVVSAADMLGPDQAVRIGENRTCEDMPRAVGPVATSTLGGVARYRWPIATPFVVSPEIADGRDTFVLQGCFGYVTNGRPAHSAFCLFMWPKGLPQDPRGFQFQFCQQGQFAD